jgi:tRNA threonylcarbamoyladenosine biosynthesis protein TsaB
MSAKGVALLVLDTATRTPTLALAGTDGQVRAERQWHSRHRHGEQLLEELDALMSEARISRADLVGVICGTGPGSFTGLRIGLATAKVIAYSLRIPIVGVSTTKALALAAAYDGHTGGADAEVAVVEVAVVLPAGAADRYVHRLAVRGGRAAEAEPPRLVADEEALRAALGGAAVVAIDLPEDELSTAAVALGQRAMRGLAAALAREGVCALATGETDDARTLVPAYVALPRGLARAAKEMTWSPDLP